MNSKGLLAAAALAAALVAPPLAAGDIKGKVTLKGMRNNQDAVVYVDKIAGKTFPAPAKHADINQVNLTFQPRVLPVLEGTTVDFLNSDAVLHNVFSPDACADKFNLGTWPKGEKRTHTFKKECFATLLCLVHPEMEGHVAVLPTPYFSTTSPDGSYEIKDVPDGSYTLKVWHAKLKTASKPVTVKGPTTVDFELGH